MDKTKFAKRLKEAREENKFSQRALSRFIGASSSMVNCWETGTNVPSLEMFYKLCKFLKVSSDYLMGLKDNE